MTNQAKRSRQVQRLAQKNYLQPFFVTAVLFLLTHSLVASASNITIVSPAQGSVVRPGDSVTFQIDVDPSLLPADVNIFGSSKGGTATITMLSGGPSYSGNLSIPVDASGPLTLGIDLTRPKGDGIVAEADDASITLNVIPDEKPLRLDVNGSIYLDPRPSGGFYTEKLSVRGLYANDIARSLTLPMLGTTYLSSDEAVVTVDIDGKVQGVSIGTAYITVENHGVRVYTQVAVRGPNGVYPPAKDISSKVSITASGFRRDPETRLYVQQLTIRNISNNPIFNPINLVISDLPEGVRLENRRGGTDVVTPLRSSVASIQSSGRILPGATATATLKFSNRDGRPITHTVRLFLGIDL